MCFITELEKWSIFSLLEPTFVTQIQLACVFGNLGNEALLITKDDDVHALGSNGAGCLGLGDMHGTLQPKKLDSLCKKGIIGFAYGSGPHVLGLSKFGEVYSWGHNGYCQLGNGTTNQGLTPCLVTSQLAEKMVNQVSCGSHHSMALTDDGEIYAWGQNTCGQVGSGTNTNQPTPRKVTGNIAGRVVKQIACGQTSSLCVLDNGEVYGWGYNGNGQLGIGNNTNQSSPCKVSMGPLGNVAISQLACGYAHTLALSDEGVMYAWGANSYGQLGTGSKTNLCSPGIVAPNVGRVVEIAASHYNHISCCMTQHGRVYMWGQCRAQSIVNPTPAPFHTLHEVFASFSTPAVTYQPMTLDVITPSSILDSLRTAFDNPESSDVKFRVEDRLIHVHKSILKIRCEHFRSMFQDHWTEGDKEIVDITQFSFPVYRAFLQYLYTDEVDLPPEDAIGLLDLANAYCESGLKRQCERIIKQGITVDSAAMLYAAAIKYQAKELEEFCFRFALNHMTAVAQTEAFTNLDESTVKAFILKAAKHGAFKY